MLTEVSEKHWFMKNIGIKNLSDYVLTFFFNEFVSIDVRLRKMIGFSCQVDKNCHLL